VVVTLKVASATFVGRVRELEHVASRLDAATGGPASIFLISGEAGVGKTRFLDEVAGRARARGVRVMEGGCVQLGVEGLPFGPIIEALRDLPDIFSPAVLDDLLGSGRTDLARLMPRLQGTTVRPVGRDGGLSSPGRLFEQFLLLLHRLGGQGPVLLAIEDIHWADASTLDLLMFLVRNLRSPVGLIATYRSDEISRTHPLVPVLATLIRSGRVERIELARFSPAEVLEQISAILGRAPDEETAEDVLTRSEGNAFYVEELLASLGDGRGLPSTLREVLIERYATLGVRARELVRTAAAAGADVRLDLLAAVMDADEATVAEALHDAIERQISFRGVVRSSGTPFVMHSFARRSTASSCRASERGSTRASRRDSRPERRMRTIRPARPSSRTTGTPHTTCRKRWKRRSGPDWPPSRCSPTATPGRATSEPSSCGIACRTRRSAPRSTAWTSSPGPRSRRSRLRRTVPRPMPGRRSTKSIPRSILHVQASCIPISVLSCWSGTTRPRSPRPTKASG
jgi:AAA ATPase domain